jgi:hypothetical protein
MSCDFKRGFRRSDFLLKYHQNTQVLKRHIIEKRKKGRKRKTKKEKKAPRVSSNKRASPNFESRKILQLQRSFLMSFHFLPFHHAISITLSKIIEKVFLSLFGPSISLAIYMS